MLEAGSVEIVGRINIEGIKNGLRQMQEGLDRAKESARASFGDITRMGDALGKIAGPLVAIGTGLAGTMLGIAALSPAVAPSLARMQADFLRLSRIMGEELQPVFEQLENSFGSFVDWLDSDEGRGAIEGFGNAILFVTSLITGAIDKLDKLNKDSEEFFTSIGFGPTPTPAGGGAGGSSSPTTVGGTMSPFEKLQLTAETALATGVVGLTGGGPAGGVLGFLAGLIGTGGYFVGESIFGEDTMKSAIQGPGPDSGVSALVEKYFNNETTTQQLMRFLNISQ